VDTPAVTEAAGVAAGVVAWAAGAGFNSALQSAVLFAEAPLGISQALRPRLAAAISGQACCRLAGVAGGLGMVDQKL
jgi:hypothetical protein